MFKRILFFLSIICSLSLSAQQVVIKGYTAEFAGRKAVLFKTVDPISNKREVIDIQNIDDNGNFQFRFTSTETQAVLVSISRMEGLLYVEPNKEYNVIFPVSKQVDVKRFDRTVISLDLTQLPEDDLNLAIRAFNADYIKFIQEHYYDFATEETKGAQLYRSALGDKVKKSDIFKMPEAQDSTVYSADFQQVASNFIVQMGHKYSKFNGNKFFKDYVRYALGELKLLSGLNRVRFYREYFDGQPILINNPAYMKTFDVFYNGFFRTDTNARIDSLTRLIQLESSITGLVNYYSQDSTASDQQVRTMVVLHNLKSTFYGKLFAKSGVIRTLESAKQMNEPYKLIGANIISQLKRYEKGTNYEDFLVGDTREAKWRLSENVDMPTYLYFFATWNTASLKELQLLEKLYAAYKFNVQIVAVCMDDDYGNFKKFIKENKLPPFKIVYGAGDPLMSDKYNVRSIPHAVMLDNQGTWMFGYTKRPSEGVEDEFKRIKLAAAEPSQGRKTWKDKPQ
jgi:thiol-disulfide isomerase/thioredoxin